MMTKEDAGEMIKALATAPRAAEVVTDDVANLLDDMAALGEHWSRNRAKGVMPRAIRSAMLQTAQEIALRVQVGSIK